MNKTLCLSLMCIFITSLNVSAGHDPVDGENQDPPQRLRNTRGETIYIKADDPHWDEKVKELFARDQEDKSK